ncbi:uncharacterized protein SPPG_01474 [Spizellomyces punctatus DAOM BR117]|uniref:Uncharacterized protein n=1 Tax=Spizellomyces punctatus (strain DAOM BR117) TaxID=645134 RepID=A0A0L0HSH5_SPIPD|nr:uncharacterized protein SPPG_01474 [Spizellomyces punctatus DAOM BR117]KND04027.1 hypothetical protein SPPG_01474 [Spizellomyces punctatus DAOM BR117]|eukprot:XP_016612066.1 hypothetical protein SPPG_01474 [Spizellomyces punctatus DAOM BR117]
MTADIPSDPPSPAFLLTRADSTLETLDALLCEAEQLLLAASSREEITGNLDQRGINLEENLAGLKSDVVLLDESREYLDEIISDPTRATDLDTLRAERDELRERATRISQTLRTCLERCYYLQDMVGDLTQSADIRRSDPEEVKDSRRNTEVTLPDLMNIDV